MHKLFLGKSGCFDRVTLSDDDGRCNQFSTTTKCNISGGRALHAVAPTRECALHGPPDTTSGREDGTVAGCHRSGQTSAVDLRRSQWQQLTNMVVLDATSTHHSKSEPVNRMQNYLSSPYVHPLPHEVS